MTNPPPSVLVMRLLLAYSLEDQDLYRAVWNEMVEDEYGASNIILTLLDFATSLLDKTGLDWQSDISNQLQAALDSIDIAEAGQ